MKFKKVLALGLATTVAMSTLAFSTAFVAESSTEAATELTGPQDAVYTIYNTTGETVTKLYIYDTPAEEEATSEATTEEATEAATEAASEATADAEEVDPVKGVNLAGKDGLKDGDSIEFTKTVDASELDSQLYTIEFTTEGGYTGTFTTLGFETVPICLLAEDAVSGATQIAFAEPEATTEGATE